MAASSVSRRIRFFALMFCPVTCALLMLPIGIAAADEAPAEFAEVDTNGDGFIDIKEAKAMADFATSQQPKSVKPFTAEQMISFMDANRDGKISKGEMSTMIAFQTNSRKAGTKERKAAEQIVASMDANKDRKISKDEAAALVKTYFGQMDTNQDGFIDVDEAWGMAYSATHIQPQGAATARQVITYLDKNGDGKISKEEATADLKPYFDQIDANKDGAIDLQEAQVMADYINSQRGSSKDSTPATKNN